MESLPLRPHGTGDVTELAETPIRLVGEGLFEWPVSLGDRSALFGARCRACHEVVFPFLRDCPNCLEADAMERFTLAGRGKLLDFVIVERGPAGYATPYAQAYIKLVDGPKIYSMLSGVELTETGPKIGQEMELFIDVIRETDGVNIVGWKFRPEEV
jgi:uncharacterized OB-fold protein